MAHLGNAVLQVQVFQSGALVGLRTFRGRHIIVGRDPTMADLVIGSAKVSREHALLEHDGQRIFVHDLSSTNGVFLNGLRVDRAEVRPHDEVHVGAHQLNLHLLHSQKAAEEARAVVLGEEGDGGAGEPELVEADEVLEVAPVVPEAAPSPPPPPDPQAVARLEGRRALVRHVVQDLDSEVRSDTPPHMLRLVVVKMRQEQILSQQLLRLGQRYRVPKTRVKERWGRRVAQVSPLTVRSGAGGHAQVQLVEGCTWALLRDFAEWDESTGVREGWARRSGSSVFVNVAPGEGLRVTWGGLAYLVRFVPAPDMPTPRLTARRRSPRKHVMRWALGASVAAHALALMLAAALAYGRPRAVLPPPTAPVDDALPAAIWQPGIKLPAVPVALPRPPPETVIGLHVPGGNPGYRLFGLVEAPPIADPWVPAGKRGPSLRLDAALLRGQDVSLAAVLPPGRQTTWRVTFEGSDWLVSSDAGRLEPAACATSIRRQATALQGCYERHLPRDTPLSAQVAVSLVVAASGAVRTVFPSTTAVQPELFGCLTGVLQRVRLGHFRGPDVTVAVRLTFRRDL